ncbi:MAG: PIN domain-containing protein [Alphaproteobacteria bacterium]|nr:PIN domain-containing protein [Alphaproteobacteria bacterium]
MGQDLFLDTCAVLWLANGDDLDPGALDAIDTAASAGGPVHISAITAWEVAMLEARGRLSLSMPVEAWFARVAGLPGLAVEPLSTDVLIRSTRLPGAPPSDPADRMIIAAARERGATLVTRDRAILDYGASGHVKVMRC